MATINIEAEKVAYQRFIDAGMTPAGACGLIGNLEAESDGFYPNRVEYLCIKKLKENGKTYTDETYTEAVDSGKISRAEFVNPLPGKQYGYGLAQWTSPGRKGGLYDMVKAWGVSISDMEAQLEFLLKELNGNYSYVMAVLKNASSIREASDIVLKKFEQPKNTSESVCASRAARGQKFYDNYVKGEEKVAVTAKDIINIAKSYIGCKESDGSHRKIIDLYNSHKPLARGYAVTYTDSWCDAFVSAVAIKAGAVDLIGTECGCEEHVQIFKNKGIWIEDGTITPKPGDIILYNWDGSTQPNDGYSDHIGYVEAVSGGKITTIEGNYGDAVKRRTLSVGNGNIRGYARPKYATSSGAGSDTPQEQPESGICYEPQWSGLVTASALNVRSWAGTKYPNIKSKPYVYSGDLVEICDTVNAEDGTPWYFIKIGDVYGFASSKYIRKQGEAEKPEETQEESEASSILEQCAKFQKQLEADIAAGKNWEYHNPSKYLEEQWANALKNNKRACNCALLARWALKEAGLIPQDTKIFYGKLGGTIQWGAGTKEAVTTACDLISIQNRTVQQLIDDGTLRPGDIVTYVDLQHTNIYAGGGKWYDAGHAYCSGSGEGAVYKSWYGDGKYNSQKVGYIIRPKAEAGGQTGECRYIIQAGAFDEKKNAEAQLKAILSAGVDAYISYTEGKYKIFAGAYEKEELAEKQVKRLKAAGFDAFIR